MPFDDQAAADRLLQQIQQVMVGLQKWKIAMGENSDVLDDMMKTYLKHAVAVETLSKKHYEWQERMQIRQENFLIQQNKLQAGLTQKAKLRTAEQDKQTREVKERHAAYFAMQKEMVDYRHSFKDFDAGLNLLSNAMKSTPLAFAAGGTIGGLKGGKGILDAQNKAKLNQETWSNATDEYRNFLRANKSAMKGTGADAQALQADAIKIYRRRESAKEAYDKSKSGFLYQMGQTGAGGGKSLGDRLEGISKWLGKNKMGVFLALGSMVILGAIIAKALDSSPMFAQMLKLWKFAIMMIFRPLGDFFGFFFRPILVLLLRKFIIPWYTTMYPVMLKLGNDLGTMTAGFIDWITTVGAKIIGFFWGLGQGGFSVDKLVALLIGTGGGIGTSFIDLIVGRLIPSAFASSGQTILTDAWDLFYNAISGILNTMRPHIKEAIVFVGDVSRWLVSEGAKVVKEGWETIKAQMPFIKSVFQWLKDQAPNVKTLFQTFLTSLEWIKNKWTQLSTHLTNAEMWLNASVNSLKSLPLRILTKLLDVPNLLRKGLLGVISALFDHLETLPFIGGAFAAFRKTHLKGLAEGGRITEPIFGIGRSGQAYAFGERGSETVIPDGKGAFGGGITINIQNMSGSQTDLNNLRQTILSVVQEANTRRGRI